MDILALSLNHRVTPLTVRETVAFDQAEGERFLAAIKDRHGVKEALLVSTCNRTEIYVASESGLESGLSAARLATGFASGMESRLESRLASGPQSGPGVQSGPESGPESVVRSVVPPGLRAELRSRRPSGFPGVPEEDRSLDALLLDVLAETRGFVPSDTPRNYEVYRNEDSVRHLFRVASGLDSQILGESQILAQVKRSIAWSRSAGTTSRILHRLWERSLRVGKRVRTETAIGLGALSASYAALELARKIFGGLQDRKVLVIGAGEIGLLVLEDLRGVPLGGLTIMNRTRSVAEELARRFGAGVRDLEELSEALVDADLVVSSTGSREPLIRYEEMKRIRGRRSGARPLLVVDLAVPRDFEERCGTLDEVFLKNIDDLAEIVQEHVAERRAEIPRAEGIIDREVAGFYRWIQTLDVEPTIRKLRELFHSIRADELTLLSGQTDEEGFRRMDRFSERLVNHLLHVLSSNLRRHEGLRDQELISVIHEILTEEIPRRDRP